MAAQAPLADQSESDIVTQLSSSSVEEIPNLQLADLPPEIITRIVVLTYQITIEELPGSHPVVLCYEPCKIGLRYLIGQFSATQNPLLI